MFAFPEIREAVNQFGIRFPPFLPLAGGQRFDLGGLELEAYFLPGHTPGEAVLLAKADRILFTGDGIIEQLWLQLEESLPPGVQAERMRRTATAFTRPPLTGVRARGGRRPHGLQNMAERITERSGASFET